MTGNSAGRRWNRLPLGLLIASIVIWALCGAAFLLLQAGDVIDICDALGDSNNIGESRWQYWPPGRECTYPPDRLLDIDTGEVITFVVPVSPYSAVSLIALAVFPVAVISALSLRPSNPTTSSPIEPTPDVPGGEDLRHEPVWGLGRACAAGRHGRRE